MAGSPTYLSLLDKIQRMFTEHPDWLDVGWDALDEGWSLLEDTGMTYTAEKWLFSIAAACYGLIAQQRGLSIADVILTAKDLHIAKNAGYAGANNPDPWANFRLSKAFGISPVLGVAVRMSDKYIRIRNLKDNPANERVGESILDTLADLAAYALIAVCLLREERLDA